MLKRFFLALALLIAPFLAVMGQFHVGAKLGASVSGTNLNPAGREVSPLAGFYPELTAGYSFNRYLQADLGLGYAQRGFKEQPYGEAERSVRAKFFTIPVYATASFPLFSKLSAGVSMGVQFHAFREVHAPAPYNVYSSDMKNPVGFLCGAQVGYELQDNLTLNLQYRLVSDFGNADEYETLGRLHSNFFMVGVSYAVPSGSKKTDNQDDGTVVVVW